MNNRWKIAACTAAMMCMAGAAAQNAVTLDKGFNPLAQASALVKVEGDSKYARGMKRIAITGFDVEFLTRGSSSASATEIGKTGTTSTSMTVLLAGVAEPEFQSIVDKLYADFAAQLTAAGFELVPTSTILASPNYRKLVASGGPSPYKKDGGGETSLVVTPEGRHVYGFNTQSKGSNPFAALSAFSSVATLISVGPDLQKELDATLVNVRMLVRFVDLQSSSKSFLNRISGSAEVKGKINPTIAAEQTHVSLQSATGGGRLVLTKPLQVDAAAIPEVKDTTSVAANVGLALLSAAIGTGSSSNMSEKQAVANPAAYQQLVGDGLGQVGVMFVEGMKTLR